MRLQKIVSLLLCAALFQSFASAFETDQYNLPIEPLADAGAEVSEYTTENISRAIEKLNAEIVARQNCLDKTGEKLSPIKCGAQEKEREKLAALRSDDAVARQVFNRLGEGFPPFTKSGSWMETHRFRAQPARYKTNFQQSIFSAAPVNYLTISSTVNLYGASFGTDKIAHVFQQGYSYYAIYKRAVARGESDGEAVKRAVAWGKTTEKTYFGTLVSGVYSNADLCANFAGYKFYLNLTRDVKIGSRIIPALLLLRDGVWTFNGNLNFLRQNLLKPFLTDHLNEALNPSVFIVNLRSNVRRAVRKRSCKLWRMRFPAKTKADYETETRALELWHGEDYGFKRSNKFVTIANTCFDEPGTPSSRAATKRRFDAKKTSLNVK